MSGARRGPFSPFKRRVNRKKNMSTSLFWWLAVHLPLEPVRKKYLKSYVSTYCKSDFVDTDKSTPSKEVKPNAPIIEGCQTPGNVIAILQQEDEDLSKDDCKILFSEAVNWYESWKKCERGKHPHIFKKYFANQISIETLVILNFCVKYLPTFEKVLSDPVWQELKNKILKYSPFLKLDIKKYKKIVLEKVNERIF